MIKRCYDIDAGGGFTTLLFLSTKRREAESLAGKAERDGLRLDAANFRFLHADAIQISGRWNSLANFSPANRFPGQSSVLSRETNPRRVLGLGRQMRDRRIPG